MLKDIISKVVKKFDSHANNISFKISQKAIRISCDEDVLLNKEVKTKMKEISFQYF